MRSTQTAIVLGLSFVLLFAGARTAQSADPDKKVGAEKCAECHAKEFKAWNETKHSRLLSDAEDDETLTKSEEIPEKLGIDDIEVAPDCASCHYTTFFDADGDEQLTSVDCESCHGAAKGWVDVHSDYGSKAGVAIENPEDESAEHRKDRWARSVAGGMLRPSHIYAVASNCANCHKGPTERVVNVGGHTPGSDFELVSWLRGEVRHNFHRTNQGSNAELAADRRRQLYVVGRGLQLEYGLRGLAEATQPGKYAAALAARVEAARAALQAIGKAAPIPEVAELLKAVSGANLAPGNGAALSSLADRVGKLTSAIAAAHDGSKLAAIDPLIPGDSVGEVYEE